MVKQDWQNIITGVHVYMENPFRFFIIQKSKFSSKIKILGQKLKFWVKN